MDLKAAIKWKYLKKSIYKLKGWRLEAQHGLNNDFYAEVLLFFSHYLSCLIYVTTYESLVNKLGFDGTYK